MFPGITDIINYLFGTEISIHFPPTFGAVVAISFLLAAITLRHELKRKEKLGLLKGIIEKETKGGPSPSSEILWNAVFGFVLGYKVLYAFSNNVHFFDDPPAIILSLKGSLPGGLITAALFGYLKYREGEKTKHKPKVTRDILVMPHHRVSEIAMMAALGGILGAKLFHVLEDLESFLNDPIGMLLSGSGLTFYGGLILGAVAVLFYAKKYKIPLIHLCDATAPGLMLAYGVGRIGCQLSGDGDWGLVNTMPKPEWMSFLPNWMWSFTYPNNVLGEGIPIDGCKGKYCNELAAGVYPTPFYEVIMGLILFLFLWKIRKQLIKPGVMFGLYLLVNGLERFLIEPLRTNSLYHLGGISFSQAQLISLLLIITGTIMLLYFSKKDFYKTNNA